MSSTFIGVLVTEMLKLAPSPEQADALLATMRACNAAANQAANVAFQHRTANKITVQKLCYYDLRYAFGLSPDGDPRRAQGVRRLQTGQSQAACLP
jgi:predicted transposase